MGGFWAVWWQAAGYIVNQVFYWVFGPITFLGAIISAFITVSQQLERREGKMKKPTTLKEIIMPWLPLIVTCSIFVLWILIGFSFLMPYNVYRVEQDNITQLEMKIRQNMPNLTISNDTNDITMTPNDDGSAAMSLRVYNIGEGTAYQFHSFVCAASTDSPGIISVYNVAPDINAIEPRIGQTNILLTIPKGNSWLVYCELDYSNSINKGMWDTKPYWWVLIRDQKQFRLINLPPIDQLSFGQTVNTFLSKAPEYIECQNEKLSRAK